MAKRKKLKNVKISEQELTPTVIGYLNEKGASPLFLIIVFGILFVFLYYLPEINVYVEQKRGNDYSENEPFVPQDNEEKFSQNDVGKEFDVNDETLILIKELSFSNFQLDSDTLSFKIKNNSSDIIDFSQEEYYIYLKDSESLVTEMIRLDDLVILENGEQDLSYTINSISISKIFIDELKEEYIPEIILFDDTLTCILEDEKYIYEFENDILKYESFVFETINPNSSLIYKYEQEKENLGELEGVQVNFSEASNLLFEIQVDLDNYESSKLEDYKFFEKEELPKVIKLKMEEMDYSCS